MSDDTTRDGLEDEGANKGGQSGETTPEEIAAKLEALMQEHENTKKALRKANEEAQTRRHALKDYESVGLTLDEIKELKEHREKIEQKKAEERGEYEKLRAQLTDQMSKREAEYKDREKALRSKIEQIIVDKEITSALAKHEGNQRLLFSEVKRAIRVEENGDDYEIRVVGADGTPKIGSSGDFMSIEEYVKSLKDDPELSAAFKAPTISGAGSKGGQGKGGGGKATKDVNPYELKNPADKVKLIGEIGRPAYEKLLAKYAHTKPA